MRGVDRAGHEARCRVSSRKNRRFDEREPEKPDFSAENVGKTRQLALQAAYFSCNYPSQSADRSSEGLVGHLR
jgi:hypothetical protein